MFCFSFDKKETGIARRERQINAHFQYFVNEGKAALVKDKLEKWDVRLGTDSRKSFLLSMAWTSCAPWTPRIAGSSFDEIRRHVEPHEE